MVLKDLSQPMSPRAMFGSSAALTLVVAAYCMVYTRLSGDMEPPTVAVSWAVVNVLPWPLAFEMAKRRESWIARGTILAAALAASMIPTLFAFADLGETLFELIRRAPWMLATAAALILAARTRKEAGPHSPLELPCPAHMIDWVSAAGNYVEFHGPFGVTIERGSLARAEAHLAGHGFVRIHRSALVRIDCVARVRPADVVLKSGRSLAVGKRFRAALETAFSSLHH